MRIVFSRFIITYWQSIDGRKNLKMDYKKQLHEMIEKITDESVLKVIYDFVTVPYSKEKWKNEGND